MSKKFDKIVTMTCSSAYKTCRCQAQISKTSKNSLSFIQGAS